MVHSGGFFIDYFILSAAFKAGTEVVKGSAPILAKSATKYFVNKGTNELNP